MKKTIALFTQSCLLIFVMAVSGRADAGSNSVQERFKSSLNEMVQQVKTAENPADKRVIIGKFLQQVNEGMARAEIMQTISPKDKNLVASLRTKLQAQYDEVNGLNGHDKVADADLNSYAVYVQQDMEQADGYWHGGGIYISCGTLILIVILILLLR